MSEEIAKPDDVGRMPWKKHLNGLAVGESIVIKRQYRGNVYGSASYMNIGVRTVRRPDGLVQVVRTK